MEKSKKPAILCVIHHRQNPLESTKNNCFKKLFKLEFFMKITTVDNSETMNGRSIYRQNKYYLQQEHASL
jgi:hypothetical protein